MNNFINLSNKEKEQYFAVASSKLKMKPHIIEKDFWVCWVLQKMFSIEEVRKFLTFKGGTSLSKVYNVIECFSEDVDLSIEKTFFGFNNDVKLMGSKQRSKFLEDLKAKCSSFIKNELTIMLSKKINDDSLGSIDIDEDDKDQQTILFHYPSCYKDKTYVAPVVKIELGARSEHWPVSDKNIVPYLYTAVPESFIEHDIRVKVLNVERTFLEKATILHYYANYPENKNIMPRQSRHYYDFYSMLKSEVKDIALKNEEACKGTLKLVPDSKIINEMQRDYGNMKEMIFGNIPSWNEIIETIKLFEKEFNS